MNADERKRLKSRMQNQRSLERAMRYQNGGKDGPSLTDQTLSLLDDVDRLEAENAALKARVAVLEKVREAAVVVAEDEIGEPGGNPFVCYFCGCHSPSSMAPWRHRDGCPMSALRAALDKAGEG